jgi:parallel beta-helix repeat protein
LNYRFYASDGSNDATGSPTSDNTLIVIDTLDVPNEYSTIQSAINAASDGDTVLVADGIYYENINFNGKAITVRSVNGASATIIDGGGNGSVVVFTSGETSASVLNGFTLQNGSGTYNYGGGIYISNSSPTITNCIISGNTVSLDGGGIYLTGSSTSATIENTTISSNIARFGGGISLRNSATVTITSSTISSNTANVYDGGGIHLNGSTVNIYKSIISGNTARYGGGIAAENGATTMIKNTIISGNSAQGQSYSDGGGIYNTSSTLTIINSTISGNKAVRYGGGLQQRYVEATVVNTIFWGNSASTNNEINLSNGGTVNATYSDIQGGWAGTGNIDADPLFVNQRPAFEAPTTAGDYHITSGSPCIDTGTNTGLSDDIDGDSRPQDGDGLGAGTTGDGSDYDIGSDEYSL